MLTRRALLASALAPPGRPQDGALRFRLIRAGADIGRHTLHFEAGANRMAIRIAVDIAVKLGPITLYRYKLRGEEIWHGAHCVAASATTDDDGSAQFMRAARRADGLHIAGSGTTPYIAPADALVASHWNQAELRGPWINLQNGKLLHPRVTPLGPDPARLADGTTVAASCFSITGPARMRLWYTPASVWTGLVFVASDGSNVRYERMT